MGGLLRRAKGSKGRQPNISICAAKQARAAQKKGHWAVSCCSSRLPKLHVSQLAGRETEYLTFALRGFGIALVPFLPCGMGMFILFHIIEVFHFLLIFTGSHWKFALHFRGVFEPELFGESFWYWGSILGLCTWVAGNRTTDLNPWPGFLFELVEHRPKLLKHEPK